MNSGRYLLTLQAERFELEETYRNHTGMQRRLVEKIAESSVGNP
jgi:hypothetical protein